MTVVPFLVLVNYRAQGQVGKGMNVPSGADLTFTTA